MYLTLEGRTIEVNLVSEKQNFPIVSNFFGNVIFSNEVHSLKHQSWIYLRSLGKITSINL